MNNFSQNQGSCTNGCKQLSNCLNFDNVQFSSSSQSIVCMDKIFTDMTCTGSPGTIDLSALTANLALSPCPFPPPGTNPPETPCECFAPCTSCPEVTTSSTFNITSTCVLISGIGVSAAPTSASVAVNGTAVTGLTSSNGLYTADISGIISSIINNSCLCCNLPTKALLTVIDETANITFSGTVIMDGIVTTSDCNCYFRLTATADNLPASSTVNFIVPNICIPGSLNGVSPSINFSFQGGPAVVLNPSITITAPASSSADATAANIVTLAGTLIVEPAIAVQVLRMSLFKIQAQEGLMPCSSMQICSSQCDNSPCCETGAASEFTGSACNPTMCPPQSSGPSCIQPANPCEEYCQPNSPQTFTKPCNPCNPCPPAVPDNSCNPCPAGNPCNPCSTPPSCKQPDNPQTGQYSKTPDCCQFNGLNGCSF